MFITLCGSSYSQPQLCGGLVSRINVRVSILYFFHFLPPTAILLLAYEADVTK